MCDEINEIYHSLLMMGPVGTPLENMSDAVPEDSWWEADGETWTVERIGRNVYTFCIDDARPAGKDAGTGETPTKGGE